MPLLKSSLSRFVVMVTVVLAMIAATLALQGCGKDQAKQDFVNRILDIMKENQAHPEIADEGTEAFQAYYESAFTDLQSAAKAEESFEKSNEKDEASLQSLEEMEKPDEEASAVAENLIMGIQTMDEGNSINATELAKAPEQSAEERSQIFAKTGEAMSYYLEGLDYIIESFQGLLEYINTNELQGDQDVQDWLTKFNQEREGIEQAMQGMSGGS